MRENLHRQQSMRPKTALPLLSQQLIEKRARKLAEQSEEAAHAAHQEMIRLTLERRAAEVRPHG